MCKLHGSVAYPLSAQIADTIEEHGYWWAADYYMGKHKLSMFEWHILANRDGVLASMSRNG